MSLIQAAEMAAVAEHGVFKSPLCSRPIRYFRIIR